LTEQGKYADARDRNNGGVYADLGQPFAYLHHYGEISGDRRDLHHRGDSISLDHPRSRLCVPILHIMVEFIDGIQHAQLPAILRAILNEVPRTHSRRDQA
jgi:hypothetical protein